MIDFKCRPTRSSYFSVSENGENGLGDEGDDGDNAPPSPRIFGLEPPLLQMAKLCCYAVFGIKILAIKHEIMLYAMSLKLPTLLTAFTA